MSQTNKLSKGNHSLLPSFNYKQFVTLIFLLLVTSSTTTSQTSTTQYECPSSCECNESTLSAKCEDVNLLIASYIQKDNNFMPIKSLDLSNNELTKLTNQLEVLVNLTELNLSNNKLTQVHKLNFENLETLDLSYNQITSGKLKKLPKMVVHLNLSHNQITYLPVDFMKLKKLRSLELDGNPLNCTCNTLHVRNWITFNHVWSNKHIMCKSPAIVKDRPWLQARQNDICVVASSTTTTTQRSKYNWDNYEDDNEIMMGDQPQDDVEYDEEEYVGKEEEKKEENADDDKEVNDEPAPADGDDDVDGDEDIFEEANKKAEENEGEENVDDENEPQDDDFMPVSSNFEDGSSTIEPEALSSIKAEDEDEDEGSGGLDSVPQAAEEDDSDESGSGIPIYIPSKDDLESSSETEEKETVEPLGIFEDNTEAPISHKEIVPNAATVDGEKSAKIQTNEVEPTKASTEDNTGTYVLIGILGICLLALIVFVAIKNKKDEKRNRRRYDVEKNGATELQDMDKRLLGKPLDKNGNGNGRTEQSPLMNDYPTSEPSRNMEPSAPYTTFQSPDVTVEEPKAVPRDHEKLQQRPHENGNGSIEPVHSVPSNGSIPKLPDSDDETFHPATDSPISPESLNVSPEPPKRYSPIYTPASPRTNRYSPVYSPETGRVKIKLTETPKAKTPILVTRSRSGAGDYVNTPN